MLPLLGFLAPFFIACILIFFLKLSPPPEEPEKAPEAVLKLKKPLSEAQEKINDWVQEMGLKLISSKINASGSIEVIASLDHPVLGGSYLFLADFLGEKIVKFQQIVALDEAVSGEKMLKGIFISSQCLSETAKKVAQKKGITVLERDNLVEIFKGELDAFFALENQT